jgi:hypothetical protein
MEILVVSAFKGYRDFLKRDGVVFAFAETAQEADEVILTISFSFSSVDS